MMDQKARMEAARVNVVVTYVSARSRRQRTCRIPMPQAIAEGWTDTKDRRTQWLYKAIAGACR